jgi:hypothetical protein
MIEIKRLVPHHYHEGIGDIYTITSTKGDICGSGSFSKCYELLTEHKQRQIRKHRMQRRRNKLYRLHPELNPRVKMQSDPSIEIDYKTKD